MAVGPVGLGVGLTVGFTVGFNVGNTMGETVWRQALVELYSTAMASTEDVA